MPEERLACKPQHYRRVLTDGPEHGQVFELLVGLAEDENTLVFEMV